jgi:glycosyltransferase involved in cell wall biosynthesis
LNSRKRILFSIPNFITAGSGREMMNIIDRLDKEVFEVSIHIRQEGGGLHIEAISKGYTIFIKDTNYKINSLKSFFRLIEDIFFFKKLKFDIWQSFDWSSSFIEPLIGKLSGSKFVYLKKNMNTGRRSWDIKYHLSDWIIARNSVMVQSFLKPYHKKVSLIKGAVDTDVFCPSEAQFRKSNDIINIVCIAQIVRVKGQDLLIKAIKSLPNVQLKLVGAFRDLSYKGELEKLINDLELNSKVVLLGSSSNIPLLLHESDIFVLPTSRVGGHEEGSPVALLEAMAVGLVCVGSNVAGTSDIIDDGKNGFLFEPDMADSLNEALHLAINSLDNTDLKANARATILKEHRLSYEASQFDKTYRKLF